LFILSKMARIRFKHTGLVLSWLLRGIGKSLHYEIVDRANVVHAQPREALIWVFWHNRMFLIPFIHQHWFPHVPGCILSSPSGDGQIIADVCEQFDLEAARGSSSKPEKGMSALIKLAEKVKAGYDVGITPDGPRGPCYNLNPGPLKLAQLTSARIMPVHVQYENWWEFKTWDRFQVPKPFSKARIVFEEPVSIPRRMSEEEFEAQRLAIEAKLRAGAVGF
jgi:hypothetical protein